MGKDKHPIYLRRYEEELQTVEQLQEEEQNLQAQVLANTATREQRTRLNAIRWRIEAILDRVERREDPKRQNNYEPRISIHQ